MSNFFTKIVNFVKGTDEDVYDEYYDEQDEMEYDDSEYYAKNENIDKNKGSVKAKKVVTFPSKTTMREVRTDANARVFTPKNLAEARKISDYLNKDFICMINLGGIDPAEAQRIADFLSGACYAIDGDIERISDGVFAIAPNTFNLSIDSADRTRSSFDYYNTNRTAK